MPEEFGSSKLANLKKPFQWLWKGFVWLRTRRSSEAIKSAITQNVAATTALAASVASVSVGVVAVDKAQDASREAASASLSAQQAVRKAEAVELSQRLADARVAFLEADVKTLDKKSAAAIKELGKSLDSVQTDMLDLADDIAALPPTPDLAPLYERAAATAKKADEASRQALIAVAGAAEQHDQTARDAAKAASIAAADAGWAAKEALRESQIAGAKAEEVRLAAEAEKINRDALDAVQQRDLESLFVAFSRSVEQLTMVSDSAAYALAYAQYVEAGALYTRAIVDAHCARVGNCDLDPED